VTKISLPSFIIDKTVKENQNIEAYMLLRLLVDKHKSYLVKTFQSVFKSKKENNFKKKQTQI
jgi:hypothetical protein